jgi:hypothetical protein
VSVIEMANVLNDNLDLDLVDAEDLRLITIDLPKYLEELVVMV